MILWASRDLVNQVFSLDPPDEADQDNWILLSTKEYHFNEIAKILDRQAIMYNKQEDYRSSRVAKDLAEELRKATYNDTTVN